MGKIKARLIAKVYACRTPGNCPGGVTSLTWVAPAAMIVAGLTPVVCFGISWMRVLEKMFWAMEMEKAPPRELKKMAMASRTG